MRWFWLVLSLASCDETKTIADGQKVTVSSGDHVIAGTLHIDVTTNVDDALVIRMTQGPQTDTRLVIGTRIVKFGAHRVRFDETGSRVTIIVHAYKPSSPLSSDDALLAADEAMSPKSAGAVDCTTATLSPDGASYMVQCRSTNVNDTGRTVKVDAATGAILSI